MKTQFRIENPDELQMTLTVTMSLRDWKIQRDQLQTSYPSWKLSGAITDMVSAATKTLSATTERDQ